MTDPYAVLGVAKGADGPTIKKAYRKLAKALHPDANQDNPAAAARFSDVARAYDLLTDKDKRAAYDRGEIDGDGNPRMPQGFGGGGFQGGFRPGQGGGFSGGFGGAEEVDLSDLFGGMFGGSRRAGGGFGGRGSGGGPRTSAPPRGGDIAYRLKVPFVDAAQLTAQRITLSDGKSIDLKLAAGVETGTQMRLGGKGQPGPSGAGDAIVTIEIEPHAFYIRDGDTIRLDLPITVKEALEGAKVKVPTVEGAVMLTIPAGSSSGRTLRLKGKGFTIKSGGRGDQLVTLMIQLPDDGDRDFADFVAQWNPVDNPRFKLGV